MKTEQIKYVPPVLLKEYNSTHTSTENWLLDFIKKMDEFKKDEAKK